MSKSKAPATPISPPNIEVIIIRVILLPIQSPVLLTNIVTRIAPTTAEIPVQITVEREPFLLPETPKYILPLIAPNNPPNISPAIVRTELLPSQPVAFFASASTKSAHPIVGTLNQNRVNQKSFCALFTEIPTPSPTRPAP